MAKSKTPHTTRNVSKRDVLKLAGLSAGVGALGLSGCSQAEAGYDVIVVGGGNSGLPAAIFAGQRGAKVLIVEAAAKVGGTLFLSSGQMSAAGTKLQLAKGIEDTAQSHYDDVMRISKNTADPTLVKLATFNAAATFDWLTDNGFEVREGQPVTGTTHEPYSHARYAWGPQGGRSILAVLEKQLQPLIDSGKVKVMTETEAVELITDKNGAVTGVVCKDEKGTSRQMGKNVVLTCGGYTFNPEMFEQMEGAKIYSQMTYPYSKGAGYKLATAVGGYIRGGQHHTPLFGAIYKEDDFPAETAGMARHFPGDRPPWEIIVNAEGKRFLQEDILSHDAYEQSLRAQPDERCWAVWDAEILAKAPPFVRAGGFGPGGGGPDAVTKAFDEGKPHFYKAATLKELAEKMKMNAAGLEETVAAYNKAQAGGGPDALGRKHMPLPIAKGPFYAVEIRSWGLLSYAGVAVNENLEVIKQDGKPVGNLYVAGELLGTGQLMGNSCCGGMSVTPALTLGRMLGQSIIKFKNA